MAWKSTGVRRDNSYEKITLLHVSRTTPVAGANRRLLFTIGEVPSGDRRNPRKSKNAQHSGVKRVNRVGEG